MKLAQLALACLLAMAGSADVQAQNKGAASRHEALKVSIGGAQPYSAVVGQAERCTDGTAGEFSCRNVDLLSFLPIDQIGGRRGRDGKLSTRLNDIWGWTDPESGREYALVGRTDGTSFVDVTDPENPVYLGDLPSNNNAVSAWRDIKVLDHHAYIVADGRIRHGLQVFDLHHLRDVSAPPTVFEAHADTSMFKAAHNIVINEETAFAYAVGSDGQCPGLLMMDLSDPENPSFAGCYVDQRVGYFSDGYTHDAQCVIYTGPDPDYAGREICFGSNETALQITDVTAKQSPVTVSIASYPASAYSHQGWLTPDQRFFFQDDELDEVSAVQDPALEDFPGTRTLIWDVEDLDDPLFVGVYYGRAASIDHNMYIVGDLAFQANYTSGLRVLDISNPAEPTEVGFFDTYPPNDSAVVDSSWVFEGAWSNYPFFESGTVIVSSIGEGLFVLGPRDAASVDVQDEVLPRAFELLAPYPNPFSDATTIRLQVDAPQRVRLAVFDVRGREVREIFAGYLSQPGLYQYELDDAGLASGTYVVRVEGERATRTAPITLVK